MSNTGVAYHLVLTYVPDLNPDGDQYSIHLFAIFIQFKLT